MTLSAGTRLGPYEILSPLGAGGMGEVYKARDTRLGREVAVKVLPESVASDPERLARFEREARLVASLNHPHIAAIYGLEDSTSVKALVLELVEGPTLQDRIAVGPIPVEEALAIARQMAEALEAAHEKGIIHRDLKPPNVKLTEEGKVKILDFGLAKALDPIAGASSPDMTHSPTITAAATQAGVVLGTAAYMSPEQARGRAADRRSGIWAFGCVLWEMLTGKRLFRGETVSDTLAAVLKAEPDWKLLPADAPRGIRVLIRRCLSKDPKQRLQAIGDVRIAIEEAVSDDTASQGARLPAVSPLESAMRRALPWAAGIILGALTAALVIRKFFAPPAPLATAIVSQIQPAPEANIQMNMAIAAPPQLSADGRRIVYRARGPNGRPVLWVRSLDSMSATPLKGTEEARLPFWSPDGRAIGFFAGGKLKRVDISGEPPVDVCDASLGWGGSWGADGVILFAPNSTSPLFRVPAGGGQPVRATSLDDSRKEAHHYSPQFLPDNRHFLFASESALPEFSGVYAGSLDGGNPRLLLRGVSEAWYASPGYLLFVQNGALMARHFDPNHLEVSGDPVVIERPSGGNYVATVSASRNGLLALVSGVPAADEQMLLEWFDRNGKKEGNVGGRRTYYTPRLSPDDREIAVAIAPPGSPTRDLWVIDPARHTERRLTFDQLHNWSPVWSPDGTEIAYASNPKGKFHIYVRPADGSGTARPLLEDDAIEYVDSWSSDGKYIAYARSVPGKPGWDIWVLPLFGDRKPFPVVQSPSNKEEPSFSPDGKWLAYDSDENGTREVYIVPFPRGEGKWQVSTGGGRQPRWRGDSRELFFLTTGNKLMAAEVREKNASLEIGIQQSLFQTSSAPSAFRTYGVTRDGKRFIFTTESSESSATPITLITNWPALIDKK
jgi:eukaryotic-like serine/threonine-protein kinase